MPIKIILHICLGITYIILAYIFFTSKRLIEHFGTTTINGLSIVTAIYGLLRMARGIMTYIAFKKREAND